MDPHPPQHSFWAPMMLLHDLPMHFIGPAVPFIVPALVKHLDPSLQEYFLRCVWYIRRVTHMPAWINTAFHLNSQVRYRSSLMSFHTMQPDGIQHVCHTTSVMVSGFPQCPDSKRAPEQTKASMNQASNRGDTTSTCIHSQEANRSKYQPQ